MYVMPKKVLIALPPAMLEQVDYIAQCEHRTRSDLIREALRRYLDNFRRTQGGGTHLSVVAYPDKPENNNGGGTTTSVLT
jgi:metal-responsive CopG/Arc/MetJ family transcriptional regulator